MWCGVSAEDQNTEIRVVAQYQKERINEKEKERLKETVTTTETIQLSIKSCYHCSAITNTLISVYNCDNTPNSNKVTGLLIHYKRRAKVQNMAFALHLNKKQRGLSGIKCGDCLLNIAYACVRS